MKLEDAIKQVADKYQLDESIVKDLGLLFAQQLAEAVEASKAEQMIEIDQLVEARVAGIQADTENEIKSAIEQFINEDIAQELQDAKRYREMAELVEGLRAAFAQYGLAVEQLDERVEQSEKINQLIAENEELHTKLNEQICANHLVTALNESGLTQMQKDKIYNILGYTSPKSVAEFKGIVDHLISEAKKAMKEEDKMKDEDDDDDKKVNESSSVEQYLKYMRRKSK